MSPQRFAVLSVLCGTLILNGWVAAELAGLRSPGIKNGGARIEIDAPRATATARDGVDAVFVPDTRIVDAALPDPPEILPAATPPAQITSASTPEPVQNDVQASAPAGEVATMPDSRETMPRAAPPVAIAPTSTPDPMQNIVEGSVLPIEVTDIGNIDTALSDPG